MKKFKLKKGDVVKVITGKDRGKFGKILKLFPNEDRIIVEGVAIVKKHLKPSSQREGGIVYKEAAIHISNVSFFNEDSSTVSRVGFKFLEDGKKVRFAKKEDKIII